jgi:2',3'-cyclic-nucleotide 2'-phosphodiesterase (5'-nucleotidase family)
MKLRNLLALLIFSGISLLPAIQLRILHTNDSHGAYLPRSYTIEGKKTDLGGYGTLYQHLESLRSSAPRALYLDAGDQQTGTAFASMEYDGVVGGAVIDVFNLLRPDACTFGNHEFDHSLANLGKLITRANYPFVSTNLLNKADSSPFGNKPTHIVRLDSLNIGFLGITLKDLPEKVKAENTADITILEPLDAINKYLDGLDRQTDLIVVLSHQGFEADSLLATKLDNRVDIIIGGHTHTLIESPKLVNGIYILQAGSYLSHLGCADMDVESDRIVSFDCRLIPLEQTDRIPNPVDDFVRDIAMRIEEQLGQVIGEIPVDWVPDKYQETEVSRWMAAALLDEYQDIYQPDLAIVNCGGFRKTIPAGPVTLRDMHEMLPFNNTVVVFYCWGRELLYFNDLNARIAINKPYDISQSTMPGWDGTICKQFEPSSQSEGWQDHHNHHFRVSDTEGLDTNRIYTVISHDYVLGQWQKYLGFQPYKSYDTGELFLDAMIRQVNKQYPPQERK